MAEAYIRACSAINLRQITVYAGRKVLETRYAQKTSHISYSNLESLLEMGAVVYGYSTWAFIMGPFNNVMNAMGMNMAFGGDNGYIHTINQKKYSFTAQ